MRNRIYLIGTVAKNLSIQECKNGGKRAFFTLKIDESYKSNEGKKVFKTTTVNLVAWDHVAEIIEKYVSPEQEIAVEATIRSNNYKGQNGKIIYNNQFTITDIHFLRGNYIEVDKIAPEP